MSAGGRVTLERVGPVLVITLDRPQARNAIDHVAAAQLEAAIDELEHDHGLRVGVLAATGPAFCAGADLRSLGAGEPDAVTERGGFAGFTERIREKPVIAAVDGPAVAGGFEIVLACDLIVASGRAYFALPEVRLGLLATAGGLLRLPHSLPLHVAQSLALTGRPLDAERAFALGLVTDLVAPGEALDRACELAEEIATYPPQGVRWARRIVAASVTDPVLARDRNTTGAQAVPFGTD